VVSDKNTSSHAKLLIRGILGDWKTIWTCQRLGRFSAHEHLAARLTAARSTVAPKALGDLW
jgi:hypothetical protein